MYALSVAGLPNSIKARREIEDRAAQLGAKRAKLQSRLAANTSSMTELVRRAEGSGIPYEELAALLGVSRQTLFNWREAARETDGPEA
jgi:DNA-binding transcriptional regulator YiaG